ncbi:hypothetical protein M9H77_09069 [Catharanthus roseus]|uniref:Uncharacterized protein n=1 Tax=Catharanthus roseus TaxID=4058 RepID=A0ACC0BZW7_CATRO|nr:hypothetical protein M9H77_09069 [Catharanthus roseus]
MVRPSGRKGDDDLGPVTDRTCRVQGHTVITSSRGVRGRHSTSDLSSTPPLFLLAYIMICVHPVYDPNLAAPTVRPHIPYRSSAQEPLTEFSGPARQLRANFFKQMVGAIKPDSSYSTHGYTVGDYSFSSSEPFMGRQSADLRLTGSFMSVMSKISGSCNKRPDKARDVPTPTKRKRVKASDWEQTSPAEGGPIDPELILSYGGHVASPI